MARTDSDLTTYARIRNSALELFAARGVKATTIRRIADRAGVSPGLVQHHFGTKANLRKAVDEFVLAHAIATLTDLPAAGEGLEERSRSFGERIGAVAREDPTALVYLARSVSDRDEAGLALFEQIVGIGRKELEPLVEAGVIAPDFDLDWIALHLTIFNLGTLMLEPGVSRVLGRPLLSDSEIDRWGAEAIRLFSRALAPDR